MLGVKKEVWEEGRAGVHEIGTANFVLGGSWHVANEGGRQARNSCSGSLTCGGRVLACGQRRGGVARTKVAQRILCFGLWPAKEGAA